MTVSENSESTCVNSVHGGILNLRAWPGISWGMMTRILTLAPLAAFAIAALSGPAPAASAVDADPAFGYWLTENKQAIVRVDQCGQRACGTMVWVSEPVTDAGALKLDLKNQDAAKRDRPICGLPLFGGLAAAKPGSWKKGWLYNPRDGQTYSLQISAKSATELKVRGFLGLPVLGSSQIWTRVDGDRGGCPTGTG